MKPEVVVYATPDLLAAATAARLITTLVDIQSTGRIPAVALTGGGVGIKLLVQLKDSSARDAVDWGRVEIFWGDERFVAGADPDRNEKQARDALLDHVPVDPARVHAMAARTRSPLGTSDRGPAFQGAQGQHRVGVSRRSGP